jgi:TetR/AcrR family transcriptional regulator, cholesterol catabolism regulator
MKGEARKANGEGGAGASRRARRHRDAKHEVRWRAVLDAAAAEFATRGFLGASTGAIAKRLGLKQGSLYYYIPSKQRALELVCQLSTEEMLGGLMEIVARNGDPHEQLRRAITFHMEWLGGRRDYCMTFLRERRHVAGPAGRLLADTARRYERLFEQMVRAGMARGRFRRDCNPAQAAFATLAVANAVALRAHRHGTPLPPGTARWIADLTLEGLIARGKRGRASS